MWTIYGTISWTINQNSSQILEFVIEEKVDFSEGPIKNHEEKEKQRRERKEGEQRERERKEGEERTLLDTKDRSVIYPQSTAHSLHPT